MLGAGLVFVVVAPYYVLGHRYLPALDACNYEHDFISFRDWEAWTSYVVSPAVATVIVYFGTVMALPAGSRGFYRPLVVVLLAISGTLWAIVAVGSALGAVYGETLGSTVLLLVVAFVGVFAFAAKDGRYLRAAPLALLVPILVLTGLIAFTASVSGGGCPD